MAPRAARTALADWRIKTILGLKKQDLIDWHRLLERDLTTNSRAEGGRRAVISVTDEGVPACFGALQGHLEGRMTTKPIDLVMFAGVDIAGNNNLWVTNQLTGISGADTNGMWLRCLASTSLAVSQTNREPCTADC